MLKKMVSYTIETLPPLTEAEIQILESLVDQPVSAESLEDIPELTDAELAEMKHRDFWRPLKQQITARVDADVLAWLKSQGKGYQSRINAILRREMLAQRRVAGE